MSKKRLFGVCDRKGEMLSYINAESLEEARNIAWYPLFDVFDIEEREALIDSILNRNLYNHFSWPIYHIQQMVIGEEAALDYMARSWAHEVAERIKHNQFINWKGGRQ